MIRPVPNIKTATIHSAFDDMAGKDVIEVFDDGAGLIIKKFEMSIYFFITYLLLSFNKQE